MNGAWPGWRRSRSGLTARPPGGNEAALVVWSPWCAPAPERRYSNRSHMKAVPDRRCSTGALAPISTRGPDSMNAGRHSRGNMAYASVTIKDIVERSVHHKWSIPEFQRGFVWKASQVRDLVESLWLHYPVGTLLVWDSSGPVQAKSASDAEVPDLWVVDGQQRTTAVCILSGRKPYWWSSGEEWEKTLGKYDIRFDVHTTKPPYFVVANAATRRVKGSRLRTH